MTDENKKTEFAPSERLLELSERMTPQSIKWVELYQAGYTPIEALRECGLATGDRTQDRVKANEMAQAPLMRLYAAELNRCATHDAGMTVQEIDKQWSDIARTNIADIVEIGELYESLNQAGLPSGAPVQGVKLKSIEDLTEAQRIAIKKIKPCPGGVEIELHDKMKALDMLAKRRQMFEEKLDVNVSGGVEIVTFVGSNGRGPRQ